jgi:hypothetical protein
MEDGADHAPYLAGFTGSDDDVDLVDWTRAVTLLRITLARLLLRLGNCIGGALIGKDGK